MLARRVAWAEWTCEGPSKEVSIPQPTPDTLNITVKGARAGSRPAPTPKAAEQDPLFRALVAGPVTFGACFFGAPGRAHPLGGVSPLHTRHGEMLAARQGRLGRLGA
jgi:hypothetical protein